MKISKVTYAIAILLAVLAGVAVYLYQSTADTRALAGKRAVNVVVAKGDLAVGIKLGDAVAQGLVGYETFPAAALPSDSLATVDQNNSNLVVSHAIGAGQLVLNSELATSANPNTQIQVPSGQIAVSASIDDAPRVANFVAPGSKVVVYWTPGDASQSRVLFPSADVIAIGATSTASTNTAQNGNNALVTFALSPAEAPKLVLATKTGTLYLGLLATDTAVLPGTGTTIDSLRSH
jgi:pilus assembly protein CpaB